MKSIEIGTQRLYWKKVSTPWVQPLIYDNGVMGGDRMAVSRSSTGDNVNLGKDGTKDAYAAFNGGSNWTGGWNDEHGGFSIILNIYVPNPIIPYGYSFYQHGGWGSEDGAVSGSTFYYRNEQGSWVVIGSGGALKNNGRGSYACTRPPASQYFRLQVYSPGRGRRDFIKTSYVTISADEEAIVPGTAQDYTYYEDVPAYYERFADGKYYGLG